MNSRQDIVSPFSLQATAILEIILLLLSYAGVIEISIRCLESEAIYVLYDKKDNEVVLIFKKVQPNHPYISTVCNKYFLSGQSISDVNW